MRKGRPLLEDATRKGKIVPVRFAPPDFAVLSQMAEKMDTTISELIRDATRLYAEETGYGEPVIHKKGP